MARSQPLTHRNQHPEYAQLVAEINGAQATEAGLSKGIREKEILLAAGVSETDRSAGNLEAARYFLETGTVRRSENSETLREDHLRLREQRDSVQKVIDLKQQALYALEQRLSAEVLANSAPDLADMRQRYVAKLRELDAIAMEERAYLRDLGAKGYTPTIAKPVAWPLIGTLDDNSSAIAMRMREMR